MLLFGAHSHHSSLAFIYPREVDQEWELFQHHPATVHTRMVVQLHCVYGLLSNLVIVVVFFCGKMIS